MHASLCVQMIHASMFVSVVARPVSLTQLTRKYTRAQTTTPRKSQTCVGPEECGCIPGYTGAPSCLVPTCAQTCEHGGSCGAPDACTCADGWFGPNCTVPVCSQTCGNGGNCTAPGTCTCASEWSGGGGAVAVTVAVEGGGEEDDCRVPVCDVACMNGGWCVAPGTCACPPQWTGQDCALPVCTQVRVRGVVSGGLKRRGMGTGGEISEV